MSTDNTKELETERVDTSTTSRSRKGLRAVAALTVVLLAGSAFVTARMIGQKPKEPESAVLPAPGDNKGAATGEAVRIDIEHAKEVPTGEPDVSGLVTEATDNGLLVGTGNISFSGNASAPGLTTDGPQVEVVVTAKTKLYRDDTMQSVDPSQLAAGTKIEQRVTAVESLPEIAAQTQIIAWGRKVGDRVIADTLIFTPSNSSVVKTP